MSCFELPHHMQAGFPEQGRSANVMLIICPWKSLVPFPPYSLLRQSQRGGDVDFIGGVSTWHRKYGVGSIVMVHFGKCSLPYDKLIPIDISCENIIVTLPSCNKHYWPRCFFPFCMLLDLCFCVHKGYQSVVWWWWWWWWFLFL